MCAHDGFLLTGLLPVLLLLLAALAGLLDISWHAQARMALQSRLDICTVRLALQRERSLSRITTLNGALRATILGIYAARGVAVASGPIGAVLGKGAEAALLSANRALAAAQNTVVLSGAASELARVQCGSSPFSTAPAGCWISPPLAAALRREPTLFPDVEGALVHRSSRKTALARVQCRGSSLATILAVRGDAQMQRSTFTDAYQE